MLFLDTIGTVFVAAVFGPWWGAATGLLTNVIQGLLTNPKNIPFFIVNVVVALIVGYIAKHFDFTKFGVAAGTGLILSIAAPLIGTPIAIAVFGGLTGGGTDWLVLWLRTAGESVFASTFIPRITGNLIDKIGTCLLVMILLSKVPMLKQYSSNKGGKNIAAQ